MTIRTHLPAKLLSLSLILALVACGGGGDSGNNGGSGATAPFSIQQVEVAQTYAQTPASTYQRLVPGKASLVRAFLVGAGSPASPNVTASVVGSNDPQCTITLSGPTQIPASLQATISANAHSGAMPAACIKAGISIQVGTDATDSAGTRITRSFTPVVGTTTRLQLVLVPLVTKDKNNVTITGVAPNLTQLRQMLLRVYPLIDSNIEISVRAPFTVTSGTHLTSETDWENALGELNDLRMAEAPGKNYYGLVPLPNFTSGLVGLGYQNTSHDSSVYWPTAIGADAEVNFTLETIAHELGHNFSRGHTVCTNTGSPPSDADPKFPYPNGELGTSVMFDAINLSQIYPLPARDVMGYCDGQYFSDYNYFGLQRFMEGGPAAAVRQYASAVRMLNVSGAVRDGKLSLGPTTTFTSTQPYLGSGNWTLRLTAGDGTVSDYAFAPVSIADLETPVQHFSLAVPAPTELAKLEILRDGQVINYSSSLPATAQAQAKGAAATTTPNVSWREEAGQLVLSWDASRYPVLAVRHVGASSTVLALRLTGGSASLPLQGIAAGGKWQFSLSHGLDASLVEAGRSAAN